MSCKNVQHMEEDLKLLNIPVPLTKNSSRVRMVFSLKQLTHTTLGFSSRIKPASWKRALKRRKGNQFRAGVGSTRSCFLNFLVRKKLDTALWSKVHPPNSVQLTQLWNTPRRCVLTWDRSTPSSPLTFISSQRQNKFRWSFWRNFQALSFGLGDSILNLLSLVGKKFHSSGLEDLIESGVYAAGTASAVMKGKSYNRGIQAHKLAMETFSFDMGHFHWMVGKPRWRWGKASYWWRCRDKKSRRMQSRNINKGRCTIQRKWVSAAGNYRATFTFSRFYTPVQS